MSDLPNASALVARLEYPATRRSGGFELMKILVVDDHGLICEALRGVLAELRPDAVVLEAPTTAAIEPVAAHADLGLILLDLNLPDGDGFSMLADARAVPRDLRRGPVGQQTAPAWSSPSISGARLHPQIRPARGDGRRFGVCVRGAASTSRPRFRAPGSEPESAPLPAAADSLRPTPRDLADRATARGARLMMRARATRRSAACARRAEPTAQESRHRHLQGPEGHQPHGGRDRGPRIRLGIAARVVARAFASNPVEIANY